MEKHSFGADYLPGQDVIIKALERPGRISMVRVDEGGTVDYFVSWWDEGKRQQEWLPGCELKVTEQEKRYGGI